MATVKAVLGELMGRLLFREAAVTSIRDVAPHFRRLELVGDDLRGVSCSAGDKVQLQMQDIDTRTYTPFSFDGARGAMELLVFVHGDSLGSHWGRKVAVGDRVRIFGPRGSLPLASLKGPVVVFGDETSFAVARALYELRGSSAELELVFEVSTPSDSRRVLEDLGIQGTLIARTHEDRHLAEVEGQVREALERKPQAHLVLTGKAQSIQTLRAGLKARPAALAGQKVKAYWAVGKKGLD